MIFQFLFLLLALKNTLAYYQRQLQQIKLPCQEYQQPFSNFYLSSIAFYKTPDFQIEQSSQNNSKTICDIDCPMNCCSTSECQNSINSNGNLAQPSTNYFIVTGGLLDNNFDLKECILSFKCFNLLNDFIYYGNDNNFQIDILKVKNYQAQYMHASIAIKRNDQYWLYYIGGKCKQQSACNQLKRFRIPIRPIALENFQSQVESYGNPLPITQPFLGSSLIYNEENDTIVLYGGSIVNGNVIKNQKEVFQFQFKDQTWNKLTQQKTVKKNIKLSGQEFQFEVQTKIPSQSLYSLLTFNEKNQLVIIGGFEQQNFQFKWQQKVWTFDDNQGLFIDTTPDYMYYDQLLKFDLNYYPNNIDSLNGFTYFDYQHIADFNQLKQDQKRGYMFINNQTFIYIISDLLYTKNHSIEECFEEIEEYNQLIGEKLIIDCYGNGKCKDKQCICDQGFSGSQCEIPTCLDDCNIQNSEFNICLANFPQSYCHCDLKKNYGGLNCFMKFCINDCSFNGSCNYETGQCSCNENYKMRDCSVFEIKM